MARSSAAAGSSRSSCPIACALDLVGDRWTLLVLRDLFVGRTRYGEFLQSPEQIPTNILAERLSRLEKAGLISSSPYQKHPPRYSYNLTAKGRDLNGVLGALAMWGRRHVSGTQLSATVRAALEGKSSAS